MNDFQILIKSFRRFNALERCVDSIVRYYPSVPILIADDSFDVVPSMIPKSVLRIQQIDQVRWIQLPYDSGLSAGRNRLVELADSETVILFDDDYVVTDATRLDHLIKLLEVSDIAAGVIRDNGRLLGVPGTFTIRDRILTVSSTDSEWQEHYGISYRQSDMAVNFFAAQRNTLLKYPWDVRFKITGEHLDFFLSLWMVGIRVVYTPQTVVEHKRTYTSDYLKYRCRQAAFRPLIAKKWGLKRLPVYSPYTEELE